MTKINGISRMPRNEFKLISIQTKIGFAKGILDVLIRTLIIWFVLQLFYSEQCGATVGSWSGTLSAHRTFTNPMSIPLNISKGELLKVNVTGQIKLGEAPWSGPEGSGYYGFDSGGDMPPYGYSHGIVMLKINDYWMPIEGGSRTLESPFSGPLSLYINDDVPGDNQGTFSVTVSIMSGIVGDADQDGLADALEDQLLDEYAPRLKFDTEESVVPADVYRYLRNSDLLVDGNEDSEKILNRKQVPYYVEWFVDQLSEDGYSTNYLDIPELVLTYCNIRNSHRNGKIYGDWITPDNTGIYGHVTLYGNSIVVQYWIFFGYNETGVMFDVGDHEGDWELFEVFLDPVNPTDVNQMQKAIWHGHGEEFLAKWEDGAFTLCPGTQLLGEYPTMPVAHPPLYIEAGTHGVWPAFVDYPYVGKNRGNWRTFVPENITNLGEVYRPRLGTEVITQFNGRWGAFKRNAVFEEVHCPPGPVNHRWQWRHPPNGPTTEAEYVGWWNAGGCSSRGRGRISWPWSSISSALNAAPSGREILIFPGTYSGSLLINQAVTLRAPHGGVVIGR